MWQPNLVKISALALSVGFSLSGCNQHSPIESKNISMSVNFIEYNFGNLTINDDSAITFKLNNKPASESDLKGSISVSGQSFDIVGGGAFNIPPGQSKSFTVRFMPVSVGLQFGSIQFTHNSNEFSSPISISLSGTGLPLIPAPDAPDQIYPLWQTNIPRDATFRWHPSARATSYRIKISRAGGFSPPFYDQTVTDTMVLVTGLPANASLWWTLAANNESGSTFPTVSDGMSALWINFETGSN